MFQNQLSQLCKGLSQGKSAESNPRGQLQEEKGDSKEQKEKEKGKQKITSEEDSFSDKDESMKEKDESQWNESSNKLVDSKYDPPIPFPTALIPNIKPKMVAYDPRRHQGTTLRRRWSRHLRASSPLDRRRRRIPSFTTPSETLFSPRARARRAIFPFSLYYDFI